MESTFKILAVKVSKIFRKVMEEVEMVVVPRVVVAAVKEQLAVTDEELVLAARVGVTEAELVQQKALDQLSDREIQMMRSGLTPVEILATRIVRGRT